MVLSARVKKNDKVTGFPLIKKQPKRKQLKFKLKGPVVIILIVLGFIFYSFGGQVVEMYNVQREIKSIKDQMEDLRAKNADLRKQVEQLSSDAYIEREAREKLGLMKPGEKIILEAKPGDQDRGFPATGKKKANIEVH